MNRSFDARWFAALCLFLTGCPSQPWTACQDGLSEQQCVDFCGQFTTCSECAAPGQCGWCADGPDGNSGHCVPALRGEDNRDQRPDRVCTSTWFSRPNDPSLPPGAPICPAIQAPPEEPTTGDEE